MSKKILVVEDSPDIHFLLKALLTKKGYTVTVVEEGGLAITYCNEEVPDLILMDVTLPDVSGLEVTQRLRENPALRNVPIMALTGHQEEGFEKKALNAGCNGYMKKPFQPQDLLSLVERSLR